MGAEPWSYYAPFEPRVADALEKLRQRVFASGEFRGSEFGPASPQEALENMDADGTASILDIMHVSATPEFFSVSPLGDRQLQSLFGTAEPTRAMIESSMMPLFEDLERGQGIYIVVYKNGQPDEYLFAGYSFD